MKSLTNKFPIFIIVFVFSSLLTSCSASEKDANEKPSAGTEQHSSAQNMTKPENKTAENKDANELAEKPQADGLPELKKGEDYAKIVREKMLESGWKPARSKHADWCGSQEIICDKFEEYESSTEKFVSFRWQKGNKFVEILTIGKTPDSGYSYDTYLPENNALTVAQNERWNKFWTAFKTAVNKKDKEKLKQMMAEKIDGGGDIETAEQRIAAIEESNMWESMQKTVAAGTKTDKCENPCRASKDGYLLFTYEMANWKWSGLGGEGGEI